MPTLFLWKGCRGADVVHDFVSLLSTSLKITHCLLKVGTEELAESVHDLGDDWQYALPQSECHQVTLHLPEQCAHGFVFSKPIV